jgi:hypothetical protein
MMMPVIRVGGDTQKQRPQRGLAEVLYARITARALGAGDLERPALFDFEPDRFRNLYQIAHSELRWKSGITPHVARSKYRFPNTGGPPSWRAGRTSAFPSSPPCPASSPAPGANVVILGENARGHGPPPDPRTIRSFTFCSCHGALEIRAGP